MKIRDAVFGDIKKIKQIADANKPNISPHSLLTYQLAFLYPCSFFWVAGDKDIVGFMLGFQNPFTKNLHLHQLAVSKNHRKKGIATAFLHKIKIKFNKRKISFGVRKFNTKALNFYKKHGFKITNEHFWFDKMFKMEK